MYLNDGEWYMVNEGDAVVITSASTGSVRIPLDIFDQVVAMRWAQLSLDQRLTAVAIRAALDQRTLGGDALRASEGETKIVDEILRTEGA